MFKEVTSKYTFIQEEGGYIEVYRGTEDISDSEPVLISIVKANTQKQFEIEVAYILVYDIPYLDNESI